MARYFAYLVIVTVHKYKLFIYYGCATQQVMLLSYIGSNSGTVSFDAAFLPWANLGGHCVTGVIGTVK